MARDVIIKLIVEDKDVDTTISKLKTLGKVDKENAKTFEDTGKKFKKTQEQNANSMDKLNGTISTVGKTIAAAFTVQALIGFGKQVVQVRGEFQRLEAVLSNTLGSKSEAQASLLMIQDFAAKTPFSVVQLTDSFVKLANQGFKPTQNEMRKLGDLANSTGKGFDQLAEAVIDAQTGEFERLKEFGIRAQKEGDKVTFTFKGVKTQTDFTSESIREYITALGDAEGVSGSMAAISETLEGKISNLGDAWDSYLNTIGENSQGIIAKTTEALSNLLSVITETDRMDIEGNALGFNRGLFQYFKDGEITIIEFAKNLKAAAFQFGENTKDVDKLTRAMKLYQKEALTSNDGTTEGTAKTLAYKNAMQVLADRINKLKVERANQGNEDIKLTAEQLAAQKKAVAEKLKLQKAADDEIQKQKDFALSQLRKAQEVYEKFIADEIKRRTDVQKEADNVEISMIGDKFERRKAELMAKFDEEIGLLDETKEDENALILAKTKKLEQDITEINKEANDERTQNNIGATQKQVQAQRDAVQTIGALNNELLGTFNLFYSSRATQIDQMAATEQISEEEASTRKKALLREQAEIQKAFTIFNTIIKIAEAIMVATTAGPIAGQILAGATAALGAVQLGIIASTPIPAFKKGTKGKQGGGLSRVGEEGEELVFLPHGAKVLPHKQTAQYSEMIDAMYDNRLDDYILRNYLPKITPTKGLKGKDKDFIEALTNNLGANGFSEDGIINALRKMDKNEQKRTEYLAKAIVRNSNKRLNLRK